jgi:anti-sigma B factor antagonist
MPNTQVLADSVTRSTDALPPAFVCSWTEDGLDAAWVRVAGELDLATVPQLERSLGKPQLQARLVVLDLRELAFMDSAGVHAIVNASIRARHVGGRLVLLRGPANVDRVFRLAGSSGDLEIREDPAGLPVGALLQVAEGELAS